MSIKINMELRKYKKAFVIVILLLIFVFLYWQNNSIVITKYIYKNDLLPDSFNGLKIIQVSDLHNKSFGKHQKKLLLKIKAANPDVIFITGDLIDSGRIDVDTAMEFVNQAANLTTVYYVPGNHEKWSGIYLKLKTQLTKAGVIILENEQILLKREGESIAIGGIMDPDFNSKDIKWSDKLKELSKYEEDKFQILLSHRPEYFEDYSADGFELVFCGHAHGGQFRFPFIGGLYAPGQGFFPKLTSGIHKIGSTTLVISRGLGNSKIPIRLFNRPELVLVTLEK